MDFFLQVLDMLLHIDVYLRDIVEAYGHLVYFLLFAVVFCETGLVVTPFLPGDSLLFASGALAGAGMLNYPGVCAVLVCAAALGDGVNYSIGAYIGPPVFEMDSRLIKRGHLLRAREFYERHGGKAIVLARFIPVIRTFAPFVAGVAGMHRARFSFFNISGALLWVFSLVTAGNFLGGLSFVKNNFSLIVYGIILVSVLPLLVETCRHMLDRRKSR
ncbi:MAG: VTT domain-containing protein [Desulfovibrio sp.]|jgi:membrane-associated protein|nr:VTT domain-containing protein [Desulfovibrio sp.]